MSLNQTSLNLTWLESLFLLLTSIQGYIHQKTESFKISLSHLDRIRNPIETIVRDNIIE